jgi:hypothetical protein
MMFSSSKHLPANNKIHSSLWLNKIPLYINTTFSSVVGQTGCLHTLAIVKNDALNLVHVRLVLYR